MKTRLYLKKPTNIQPLRPTPAEDMDFLPTFWAGEKDGERFIQQGEMIGKIFGNLSKLEWHIWVNWKYIWTIYIYSRENQRLEAWERE